MRSLIQPITQKGGNHSLSFSFRTLHSSGALHLTVCIRVAQGRAVMVIPGRAALEQGQDLLGGVMVATSQETAVTSEDLKRDHGAGTWFIPIEPTRYHGSEISLHTWSLGTTRNTWTGVILWATDLPGTLRMPFSLPGTFSWSQLLLC